MENVIKCRTPDYIPSSQGLGFEMFESMKRHQDKPAQYIVETNEVDYYHNMLERCVKTSRYLLSKGINQKDVIATCTSKHINSSIPFVATQFIGSIIVSLDIALPVSEMIYLLQLVQPKIIFISTEALEYIEDLLKSTTSIFEVVVFGPTDRYISFSDILNNFPCDNFKPVEIEDNKQTCIIFFSSGTTGLPKAFACSHFAKLMHVVITIVYFNMGESCKLSNYNFEPNKKGRFCVLQYSNLYWIGAVNSFLRNVLTGSPNIICSRFDEILLWEILDKYNVTYLFLQPHQLKRIKKVVDVDTSNLKIVAIGGSALSKVQIAATKPYFPNSIILNMYGQTEFGSVISVFNVNAKEELHLAMEYPSSCGRPLPGITWKIVDVDTGTTLGPNKTGEFMYKSEYALTRFDKDDLFVAVDEEGWIKSGDIGYYNEQKCIFLVDRIKELIKYQGMHVAPAYLESILESHDEIKEAAVIGIPNEGDEYPMALVTLKDENSNVTSQSVQNFVSARVSDKEKLRGGVKIVKEFPRSATGKIKRLQLKYSVLNNEI